MSASLILMLVVPLLIFTLVDTFASLKFALISAALVALAEVGFTLIYFGEIDSFSVASVFLVLLMAGLAYIKDSRKIFFFKPAILSFALGAFLLVTYFMGDFVIYDGLMKYGSLMSPEISQMLEDPRVGLIYKKCSLTCGWAFVLHGLAASLAALKMDRWGWFMVAGIGFYFFFFFGVIAAIVPVMF